jgi:hypothetical protein
MLPRRESLEALALFMPPTQRAAVRHGLRTVMRDEVSVLLTHWCAVIEHMPITLDTEGEGDAATVHLHYFLRESHWFILELDDYGNGRAQALGMAYDGQQATMEYINIDELITLGAELDMFWPHGRNLGQAKQFILDGAVR